HFNITNTSSSSRARDLVVSSPTPAIRAVLHCAIHNIPGDYDRTVLVEVEAADYIIDYLTKISAFNLQPPGDMVIVDNSVMANFVLHLSSYVGVGHAKVAPTTRVHCCTTRIGANTQVPRSVESTTRNTYCLNIVETRKAGDTSVRPGHA